MDKEKCLHHWEMVNVSYGYIITEQCFKCEKVSNYFTQEHTPPLEEYRDGEHFWNVMKSDQSFKFNLKCSECNTVVDYDELLGLMMCTGCDKDCEVDIELKKLEAERIWVYVAFGFLPIGEKKQLSDEKIKILEDYFNQRRRSSNSSIRIISHEKVRKISACYAEVIKDVNMVSLTAPDDNI
ncbi:MAG: hypothetical protein ABFR75_04915 [Acidobacteriota bacterium]